MEDKILDLAKKSEEVGWKTILLELVQSEQMDPWDIDVSSLSKKYIQVVKKMQELDLHISGKIILAAAILLKIKSDRLVGEDVLAFDSLLKSDDEEEDLFDDDEDYTEKEREEIENQPLIPRTPQLRKRKVSVYDLVDALSKALEVKNRRVLNKIVVQEVNIPDKKVDITKIIGSIYEKITLHYDNNGTTLKFSDLIVDDSNEGKVFTLLPLLYLDSQGKVELVQKTHFDEIMIHKQDYVLGLDEDAEEMPRQDSREGDASGEGSDESSDEESYDDSDRDHNDKS